MQHGVNRNVKSREMCCC